MKRSRQVDPPDVVLALALLLVVTFVLGLSVWHNRSQVVGFVLVLLAIYAAVFGLVVLGCFVQAGLPRGVPFGERNLLTSRLAWTGRSIWAAIVLAAGGYFGAIIATDLSFRTSEGPPNRVAYLVSIAVLLAGFAAVFVVAPIAIVSGIGILRAGRRARGAALRKTTRSFSLPERWVEHLASPLYAWAALGGFVAAVPLSYAIVFWISVALGVSY